MQPSREIGGNSITPIEPVPVYAQQDCSGKTDEKQSPIEEQSPFKTVIN